MAGGMEYDFVLSILVFLSAYAAIVYESPFIIQPYKSVPDQVYANAVLSEKALLGTAGEPLNWNNVSTAKTVGLLLFDGQVEQGVLDPNKVLALNNTNCSEIAEKAGLVTGNILVKVSWAGNVSQCVPKDIVGSPRHLERTVSVNGTLGKMEVWAW